MRIVLDLQGAQSSGSRNRGIGRYSLSLAQAMARQAGKHELWLVLNGRFADTIEPLRAAFERLVPQHRIRVFDVPGPVAEMAPANHTRLRVAEQMREAFLAELRPDVVHVSSLFEGLGDDAVSSVGVFEANLPTAVTLYDLIRLLRPRQYLTRPEVRRWYLRKAQSLKRADLLLAISESSRREAIEHLQVPPDRVVTIGAGVDGRFRVIQLTDEEKVALRAKYGLRQRFVMYAGGIDPRKNVEGLVEAYALLPPNLRRQYQLVVAGAIGDTERSALAQLAGRTGMDRGELVLIGYVPDDDLVALYNICELFVFPSLHEGFGLPVVEAMACGAPVIGSNASSIPEVIGRADALFDPTRPESIADKITEALTDVRFRESLRTHGLKQATRFTWEAAARKALEAFEDLNARCRPAVGTCISLPVRKPRLAYVSPLPPERTGIADYSTEILPELARFYDIEVVVWQREVTDSWVLANFPVRDVAWFERHAEEYERVLYHFGNSQFHAHMFELLSRFPGTAVLHDVFLSGVLDWMERTGQDPEVFLRALYASHGYAALVTEAQQGREAAVWAYPCSGQVFRDAVGVIVHSRHAVALAQRWYGQGIEREVRVVPQPRVVPVLGSRSEARTRLGIRDDEFLVCCFGFITPTKLNHRLLAAWLRSSLSRDARCRLAFVGENHGGDYGRQLVATIMRGASAGHVDITGFVTPEQYRDYLTAADVAVQLRTQSRGETPRTVLDCLAHGLPLVVNAHGANAELPQDVAIVLKDDFEDGELIAALERLRDDAALRAGLARRARKHVERRHHPAWVAEAYHDVIEEFWQTGRRVRERRLIASIAHTIAAVGSERGELAATAAAMAANRVEDGLRRLFVDVSELALGDVKTGIQRVVRGIVKAMVQEPPSGFQVEPVRLDGGVYRHARRFTLGLLGLPTDLLADDPVEPRPGDVFLGLDLTADRVPPMRIWFERQRGRGAHVYFVVYDLLPILRSDAFPSGLQPVFEAWLRTIAAVSDGLVCISRSVADELVRWLEAAAPARYRPLSIGYFHLGADIRASLSSAGIPDGAKAQLAQLRARPSFLMVGTVEPRKGYAQALGAFERLWAAGVDVNLVIVGKQGWMVERLAERLRSHPELGKRLFRLEGISDEYLEKVYDASVALIAASEGEGFGLPLVEAARHRLPIIARDIPVFREVVGDHALYFEGTAPEALADAIRHWLALRAEGAVPRSDRVRWLTWKESTRQLLDVVLGDRWYRTWPQGTSEQRDAVAATLHK
jgi:glycosyltransferase involved in cell wall biosynthesis